VKSGILQAAYNLCLPASFYGEILDAVTSAEKSIIVDFAPGLGNLMIAAFESKMIYYGLEFRVDLATRVAKTLPVLLVQGCFPEDIQATIDLVNNKFNKKSWVAAMPKLSDSPPSRGPSIVIEEEEEKILPDEDPEDEDLEEVVEDPSIVDPSPFDVESSPPKKSPVLFPGSVPKKITATSDFDESLTPITRAPAKKQRTTKK
jgi:hypothetical protein